MTDGLESVPAEARQPAWPVVAKCDKMKEWTVAEAERKYHETGDDYYIGLAHGLDRSGGATPEPRGEPSEGNTAIFPSHQCVLQSLLAGMDRPGVKYLSGPINLTAAEVAAIRYYAADRVLSREAVERVLREHRVAKPLTARAEGWNDALNAACRWLGLAPSGGGK